MARIILFIALASILAACAPKSRDVIVWGKKTDAPLGWYLYCGENQKDAACKCVLHPEEKSCSKP